MELFKKSKKNIDIDKNTKDTNEKHDNIIEEGIKTVKFSVSTMLTIVMTIVLSVCILVMVWLTAHIIIFGNLLEEYRSSQGDLSGLTQVMAEIQHHYDSMYIGDKNELDFVDKALAGFTYAQNDKYGYYLSPSDSKDKNDEYIESLVGIGVHVVNESDLGWYVSRVIENSPAKDAGIIKGDYIVEVNGESFRNFDDPNEFINRIKGISKSTVNIGINRNGEIIRIDVIRREVQNKSVIYNIIKNDIAYIKITSFTSYTDEEFKASVEEMKKSGIDKFIIDLRDNTGGAAETVIDMCDYMLPEGLIARFEYVDKTVEYNSKPDEAEGNFVILVNELTASASELFTRTLQEYGKAKVVGVKTFGKGTVITTIILSNGGTLTLSSAKYYTKSGIQLEGNGVDPDYVVELSIEDKKILYKLPIDEDEQLLKAIEVVNNMSK